MPGLSHTVILTGTQTMNLISVFSLQLIIISCPSDLYTFLNTQFSNFLDLWFLRNAREQTFTHTHTHTHKTTGAC
jgi:hypothetical protein